MTTGLILGLLSLYHTFATPSFPQTADLAIQLHMRLQFLDGALLFVLLYFVPATSGILYPGAGWTDPEFGDRNGQMFAFPGFIIIAAVGWWMEKGRVRRELEGRIARKGK
jgi:hypothetical protein